MHDWDDNPDVRAVRLQSMAEVCGLGKKPKRKKQPPNAAAELLEILLSGDRVFIDGPDGTVYRVKAKRVKQ